MDSESNPAESAECFIQLMLDQYMSSSLSAETVCTLAYWAMKAGMKGYVERVARKPGMSSGNYSKALKQVLGFNDKKTYKLEVPGTTKHDPCGQGMGASAVPLLQPEMPDALHLRRVGGRWPRQELELQARLLGPLSQGLACAFSSGHPRQNVHVWQRPVCDHGQRLLRGECHSGAR